MLRRHDKHSLRQAEASVVIGGLFVEDLLAEGKTNYAQDLLVEMEHMLRSGHVGKPSHLLFGKQLNPKSIIQAHLKDTRLDPRWREMILSRVCERIAGKEETSMARHLAETAIRDTGAKDPRTR